MAEDYFRLLAKQKNQILDCTQLMANLGESGALAELDTVLKEFEEIQSKHSRFLQALNAMCPPEATAEKTPEEMFQQELDCISTNEDTSSDTNDTDEDSSTQLGDTSCFISQVEGIPIDPITKNPIQNPARNKICNHVYEYNVIIAYLNQAKRGKKKKCPYIGCSNMKLLQEHIEKDDKLQRKIIAMANTGEADPNLSVVDIC